MRYIYVVRNLVNHKVYVGQTINPARRKAGHWSTFKNEKNEYPLPRAMRKYGIENFVFEVIEECATQEVTNEREKFWIQHFDSRNRDNGYNLHVGGCVGNDESFQKISEALKGNKHCVGRKFSVETKKKLSAWQRGKTISEETREKIRQTSAKKQLQRGEHNSQYGKRGERHPRAKLTQEQADKIRERLKAGEKPSDIAPEFNVSRYTIARIGQCVIYVN